MEKEKKKRKVNNKVYENIIIAVAIMLYFIIINFSYFRIEQTQLLIGLKIASIILLCLNIVVFEIAYRKDSGRLALHGVELLVLAAHTLSTANVVEVSNLDFSVYILISSYAFSAYYILKAIIIYTIEKRKYLESFNDIKEIVDNKPTKKEATKKKIND